MRIARVEIGGGVRAAIVSADASSVRPLPPDVSVLDLLGDGRDAVAARAGDELALESVRLLAPVQPPSIRDFSVFEQHIEGVIRNGTRPPRSRRRGTRRRSATSQPGRP